MALTGIYVLFAGFILGLVLSGGSFLFFIGNFVWGNPHSGSHEAGIGGMVAGGLMGCIVSACGMLILVKDAFAFYG